MAHESVPGISGRHRLGEVPGHGHNGTGLEKMRTEDKAFNEIVIKGFVGAKNSDRGNAGATEKPRGVPGGNDMIGDEDVGAPLVGLLEEPADIFVCGAKAGRPDLKSIFSQVSVGGSVFGNVPGEEEDPNLHPALPQQRRHATQPGEGAADAVGGIVGTEIDLDGKDSVLRFKSEGGTLVNGIELWSNDAPIIL